MTKLLLEFVRQLLARVQQLRSLYCALRRRYQQSGSIRPLIASEVGRKDRFRSRTTLCAAARLLDVPGAMLLAGKNSPTLTSVEQIAVQTEGDPVEPSQPTAHRVGGDSRRASDTLCEASCLRVKRHPAERRFR